MRREEKIAELEAMITEDAMMIANRYDLSVTKGAHIDVSGRARFIAEWQDQIIRLLSNRSESDCD